MISDELIIRSIINYLRSRSEVIGLLGSDPTRIVEENFQDFVSGYPRITLRVFEQPPTGTGTDRLRLSRVVWNLSVFSENNSSAECNRINGVVLSSLFNSQIIGVNDLNIPSFRFLRVDLTDKGSALRVAQRLWKAESMLESEVYSTTVHL